MPAPRRSPVAVGQRIRLDLMTDDPNPIPPGSTGIVLYVTDVGDWFQVDVKWDNSTRTLSLCIPPDRVTVLSSSTKETL